MGSVNGKNDTDSYNFDGSVASLTAFSFATTYTYNGAGRPITAKNNGVTETGRRISCTIP